MPRRPARAAPVLAALGALSASALGQGVPGPAASRAAASRDPEPAARRLLGEALRAGLGDLEVRTREEGGRGPALLVVAPSGGALPTWRELARFLEGLETGSAGLRAVAIAAISYGDEWRFATLVALEPERRDASAYSALALVLRGLGAIVAEGELDTVALTAQGLAPADPDHAAAEVRCLLLGAGPQIAVLERMAEIGERLAGRSAFVRVEMSAPLDLGDGRWLFEIAVGVRAEALEGGARGRAFRPPAAPLR